MHGCCSFVHSSKTTPAGQKELQGTPHPVKIRKPRKVPYQDSRSHTGTVCDRMDFVSSLKINRLLFWDQVLEQSFKERGSVF